MKQTILFSLLSAALGIAVAAPVSYKIDPAHTFPSFEADHMGISVWRGKFNTSSGTVTLDKGAGFGMVDVSIDTASIDFGHDVLNSWAAGKEFFDSAKYGPARYKGLTGPGSRYSPRRRVVELVRARFGLSGASVFRRFGRSGFAMNHLPKATASAFAAA
jgi:hypothetical protein